MIKRLKSVWRKKICFWYYRDSYEEEFRWYSELAYWIWHQSRDAANGLHQLFHKKEWEQRYGKLFHFNPLLNFWRFLWRISFPVTGPFIFICVVGRMAFGWGNNHPEFVRWFPIQ